MHVSQKLIGIIFERLNMPKVLRNVQSTTYSEERYGQKVDKPKQVTTNRFYSVINNQQFSCSP